VLTFLTGFIPTLFAASATGVMVSLCITRLLLGATNAPIFPVMAGAFARWFPEGGWGFPNGATSVGLALGQAAIGPIVTMLIVHYGWRGSFYVFAPLGLLIGAWWYWYARDRPAQHPAITAEEVRLIEGDRPQEPALRERGAWRHMLVHRDVLLIATSYFCMNYVFYMFAQWLFTYLVEARGFSLLESGWLYVLPGLLFYGLFTLAPLVHTVYISLFSWDGLTAKTYTGLANYRTAFADHVLLWSFVHSGILILFYSVLPVVVGLALTAALTRHAVRGFRFFRTALFLPQLIAGVVIAQAWSWIYDDNGRLQSTLYFDAEGRAVKEPGK
jgi:MFS family permease